MGMAIGVVGEVMMGVRVTMPMPVPLTGAMGWAAGMCLRGHNSILRTHGEITVRAY
ncbi:MAG: hypothetical protein NVS9B4_21010 [Candidatus Acidiferrum sp.]